MKHVVLITNLTKDFALKDSQMIVEKLRHCGAQVYVDMEGVQNAVFTRDPVQLFGKADVAVVLGGDGTLLRVARRCAPFGTPVLGVNYGRLGFLVELERKDTDEFSKLFQGEFSIEERMMLAVRVVRDGKDVFSSLALNDAVVTKGALSRMIRLRVEIDGQLVERYPADGLVVATPTGSTAYSLSAGGPVVSPEIGVMILTPICPHTLTARPVVVADENQVQITVDFHAEEEVMLTLDGQEGFRLSKGDEILVTKSEYTTKLVRLNQHNFFERLNKKLAERG